MTQHSQYSPSQIARIIKCPGSVRLSETQGEQTQSEAARQGEIYHSIVEQILRDKQEWPTKKIIEECQKQNVPVEVEAIQTCTFWAKSKEIKYATPGQYEQKVSLSGFDLPEVYGTADFVLSQDKLIIADWKFGKGIYVDETSDQLKCYALGAARSYLGLTKFKQVEVTVVQPRYPDTEPIRTCVYTPNQLIQWLEHTLRPAIANAIQGIGFQAGSHCKWCAAKHICRTRYISNLRNAQAIFQAYASTQEDPDQVVSTDDLVKLYNLGQELMPYIKSLGKYLSARLKQGEEVPGMKLVRGRSIRRWKDLKALEKFLQEETGMSLEDISESKLMGPAKVEKILSSGLRKKLNEFIEKPEGKLSMVPSTDARPAVEYAEALFSKYVEDK
jgi:hypothetical protein